MENKFKLSIRTPQEDIFEGEVEGIHFASEQENLEVFANHSSLTSSMTFAPITVKVSENKSEKYYVRNGLFLFENDSNQAKILAINCEKSSEINKQSAAEYLKTISEQLEKGEDLSEFQILYLQGEKIAIEKQLEELN